MHFTCLYLLKGKNLEDLSRREIEYDFQERFCDCCGETRPMYKVVCDWFKIGGRWNDELSATEGIKGEPSWMMGDEYTSPEGKYSIVEIKDLTEAIDRNEIYMIAQKSIIYYSDSDEGKVTEILDKINQKKIKGVIALIDCHI